MENKYFIQLKWLLIGSLITSTAMSFIWPLNTIYMHNTLHQTLTVAGIVLGVNQLATMLGNWLGGILFDQWSIYYTSLVGVMINILALGLLIFLNSWPIYAFLIVLSGFSNGILTTCIYSLATRVQNKKTSSIFNMLYFTSNFGLVFGTLAVGYLLKIGVSYIFTLASLTQVIFLIIVIRYFNIVNYNKGYSKKKVVVKGKFLIWSVLLALLLSWVVYTQWQSNLSAYMLGKGFSIKQYSFLWTLNAVLIITFQPVLTLFNDFLIKHIISRINVGLFLFAVAFFILLLNHNYFILGISMAFLTFGEILLFPGVASLVDIYAPNNESGIYQGLVQMFTAGGKAVGPFIGAAIIDCSNYKVLFLCLVLIIMAAIFIFSFSVYQNKRHALDQ
ncbi:MFS transporter [Lactobacillus mellis]|uniref:MFS transporter n=1 Tax=Bombilactobacillus mellis TaxID=1218508 RepID=UPI001580856C|nr:MFS transporter [Bombilactobacillus mellis]NUG67315.1 MFS transporter [Bombilactobacillus mellis]